MTKMRVTKTMKTHKIIKNLRRRFEKPRKRTKNAHPMSDNDENLRENTKETRAERKDAAPTKTHIPQGEGKCTPPAAHTPQVVGRAHRTRGMGAWNPGLCMFGGRGFFPPTVTEFIHFRIYPDTFSRLNSPEKVYPIEFIRLNSSRNGPEPQTLNPNPKS